MLGRCSTLAHRRGGRTLSRPLRSRSSGRRRTARRGRAEARMDRGMHVGHRSRIRRRRRCRDRRAVARDAAVGRRHLGMGRAYRRRRADRHRRSGRSGEAPAFELIAAQSRPRLTRSPARAGRASLGAAARTRARLVLHGRPARRRRQLALLRRAAGARAADAERGAHLHRCVRSRHGRRDDGVRSGSGPAGRTRREQSTAPHAP